MQVKSDKTYRAQDDFYRFINHEWLDTYTLPPDKSRFGTFDKLAEQSDEDIHSILEDSANKDLKSSVLYRKFMDQDAIEAKGIEPIAESIKEIKDAKSMEDLLKVMAPLDSLLDLPFDVMVFADPKDPDINAVHIMQGGIGLPDESYYREPRYTKIVEAYQKMLSALFGLIGEKDPDAMAKTVVDLETKIAHFHWDSVQVRDDIKTYNPMTRDEFADKLSNFNVPDWISFVQTSYETHAISKSVPVNFQSAIEKVIVHEPSFLDGLNGLWKEEGVEAWKDWALARLLTNSASFLTKAFDDTSFDFYGKVLKGQPAQKDRWKRAVSLVNSISGEEVGKIYVKLHFPASSKEQVKELVGNLLAAYKVSIANCPWLGDETKGRALDKLSLFTPMIGYPEEWKDYSALEVDDSKDLMDNMRSSYLFMTAKEFAKAGKKVDKGEWEMNPQTVNAYYEPTLNEIVFPAAILQDPFFSPDRPKSANFGGIGCVIGHEIGHGFDDQGSCYDGHGRLENWWTDDDRKNFKALTQKLIDQYNKLVPLQLEEEYAKEGKADQAPHVNGAMTIGENIGDLSGVDISLKALAIHHGLKVDTLEDLKASIKEMGEAEAKLFFSNYALIWRMKIRDAFAEQLLAIDPHSPAEFRTNQILKNVDAFDATYDVKPGDGMWLDPDDRVRIW
ncbi:MAG: peptidase M13 [Aeriscardovia sp.]|nr:peptidase M13 [Aeriscardovia sp.]